MSDLIIEPNYVPLPIAGVPEKADPNIVPSPGGSAVKGGLFQSANYVPGVSGWILRSDGTIEIQSLFGGAATAYAAGTGLFAGFEDGVYKVSIGSSTAYIRFTGTGITILGVVDNIKSSGTYQILYSAGDTGGTGGINQTTYYKVIEAYIRDSGVVSVSFDLMLTAPGGGIAYGRIYKNDVAVGTERSTSSGSFTTYTEDITVARGDLLQLYVKHNGGGGLVTWRYWRVKADAYEVSTMITP